MKHQTFTALASATALAFTLACSSQSGSPTSPNGLDPAGSSAYADGSTLKVTAPVAVSPAGGIEIDDTSPELVINNSTPKFVQSLALSYVFEVLDAQNRVVYRSNPVAQGGGGRTSHEVDLDLDPEGSYSWRAHAVFQTYQGPRAAVASFKTLSRFGVSCAHLRDFIPIVGCRFDQHGGGGGMDPEETIQFMREVAYDLNRAGLSDRGGFGVLIKTVGNNCLGYSCDIICEGHGNDQNQYDILIDERIPNWGEVEEVTVRECEIVR